MHITSMSLGRSSLLRSAVSSSSRTSCRSTRATVAARFLWTAPPRSDAQKTFANQSRLPRLPVPDLEKALEAYVKSLLPVMEQRFDRSTLPKELEKRRIYARDFAAPGGLGQALQQRLLDLDHVSPNNWLNDTLWLPLAYHTWRAPLIVNSNWWLLFAPDPNDPAPPVYDPAEGGVADGGPPSARRSRSAKKQPEPDAAPREIAPAGSQGGGAEWLEANALPTYPAYEQVTAKEWISDWQVRKAAWLLNKFAEFRTKVQKEELEPDTANGKPLDMEQYKQLFNFSRIPLANSDAFSRPARDARHATVLIDDFVYSIDVFDSDPTVPLSPAQIEANLAAVVDDARQRLENGEQPVPVGILSADDRDNWTKNRERLLLLSSENRPSLESISTSLLVLSLDSYTLPSLPTTDPLRLLSIDAQLRACSSGINGGENRWFDKSMSLIVENNGRAGLMGEHSPVDASIPSAAVKYALAQPVESGAFRNNSHKTAGKFIRHDWKVEEAFRNEIEECRSRNKKVVEDSDATQLWWSEYGCDWIQNTAKQSPDAFIQQALQLAWFRDQGYATATYETASTRSMLHGRTDAIRSLTSDSRAFVKAMTDDKIDKAERYHRLTVACKAHNALAQTATSGHGLDRHLLGLRHMLQPGETHALFEDELYAASQEWKMSTSGLGGGTQFNGLGFGAAWPNGYSVSFLAGPNQLKFGVESKHSCDTTSSAKFKHHLVQALRDMREVCDSAAHSGEGGSLDDMVELLGQKVES